MENAQKLQLDELLRSLEEWAPLSLQESYDNAGLVLGNRHGEVHRALILLFENLHSHIIDSGVV